MSGIKRQTYINKRAKIVQMLEQGATTKEIKDTLGYKSLCQIYRVRDEISGRAKERGNEPRQSKHYGKNIAVLELYKDGKTPKMIAEELGFASLTSVYSILKKNGINPRDKIKERNEEIAKARKDGVPPRQIAEEYDLSISVVNKICRNQGLHFCQTYVAPYTYSERNFGECECALCGKRFKKRTETQVYCSDKCRKKALHERYDPQRDERRKNAVIDIDITLEEVFRRDGGVCYLCGKPCDWADTVFRNGRKYASKHYPTIDHVRPLSKGGRHEWKNVRLAHLSCNSSKGAKLWKITY